MAAFFGRFVAASLPSDSTRVAARAERDLQRLPETIATTCVKLLLGLLADNPQQLGKSLLSELSGLHAARRGDYRVIYRLGEDAGAVEALHIDQRSDVDGPGTGLRPPYGPDRHLLRADHILVRITFVVRAARAAVSIQPSSLRNCASTACWRRRFPVLDTRHCAFIRHSRATSRFPRTSSMAPRSSQYDDSC